MLFTKEALERLVQQKKTYDEKVSKALEGRKGTQKHFITPSGEVVEKILYTPLDVKENEYEDLGVPGAYPYTRGVQDTMYRGRMWTMRMYAGFATARESNERYKLLIESGGTGLSVAFDLPTQIGLDSDDPLSEGEVGKVGVAIDSLADVEMLFDGIDLSKVSTSMTINAPASVLLAMYIVAAKKKGIPADKLSGTIQNDILKEYIARGTYIYPTAPSMRLITNIFEYCSKHVPKWNTISISGYHIREAGSTASQEVGFTLADGIAYVEAAIKTGLDIDTFAPRLSFFFNAHNDFLKEIAKYRAARRLWAKIMRERFHAKNPKSMTMKFHCQTAGSTLTAQQADNNIVRVAIQTMAAILGGAQSLHTNSRDEALALPTEESVQIALRTQQIVGYESGITKTVDALGGSYCIETLTNEIEAKAMGYINKIDELGGAAAAIDQGYIQGEITEAAYIYQMEIEQGERVVVGVNKYQQENEPHPTGLLKVDLSVGKSQAVKLAKLRAERDSQKVEEALSALRKGCEGEDNLMPLIVDAVEVYATLGEICNVMRDIFGEYKQKVMI